MISKAFPKTRRLFEDIFNGFEAFLKLFKNVRLSKDIFREREAFFNKYNEAF
jgi:hypothetical protein